MFDYESPKEKSPTDWSGTIIGAMLLPVFAVVTYFVNAEVALTACIVLGLMMLAVKLRWKLRKHVWFWATIAIVLSQEPPCDPKLSAGEHQHCRDQARGSVRRASGFVVCWACSAVWR